MSKFIVGNTYWTRSIGDSECIFEMTVIARTPKTIRVAIKHRDGVKTLRPFIDYNGHEAVKPFGSYSMCAIISADEAKCRTPELEAIAVAALDAVAAMHVDGNISAEEVAAAEFFFGPAPSFEGDMLAVEEITIEAPLLPDNVISFEAAKLARDAKRRQAQVIAHKGRTS